MHPMGSGYELDTALLALSALGDFFAWLLGGLAIAGIAIGFYRWWCSR